MSTMTVSAVLGLAVLDMLSPALLGVALYLVLARPPRLGRLMGTYLTTVAVSYLALGVILMLGLEAALPAISPSVWPWIQGGIGVALFAASWFIPTKRKPDKQRAQPRSFTTRGMVILGLGTWLFEFYTAVPYFGAIGIMTSAGLSAPQWLSLLGIYVLIMILPGILVYLGWLLLRDRVHQRFETWHEKIINGSRSAVSWIIGIVGVLLLIDALPSTINVGI